MFGIRLNQPPGNYVLPSYATTTTQTSRTPQRALEALGEAEKLSVRINTIYQFIKDLKNPDFPPEKIAHNLSTYFPAIHELHEMYEAFALKKIGHKDLGRGREIIKENVRELLTMRDWDGNLLPEQMIRKLSEQRDLYREIATLYDILESLELANGATGQNPFFLKAQRLFKELKGHALRSLCAKVYEIDSSKPHFHTADPNYGFNRISQDVSILKTYQWGGNTIVDCAVAENRNRIGQMTYQLTAAHQNDIVIPNTVRNNVGKEYMQNILRLYELQDLITLFKDPLKNKNNELLLQKLNNFDNGLKEILYKLIWIAYGQNPEFGFAERIVKEDIHVLTRIQNREGENILEQLAKQYQEKIHFQENIYALELFDFECRQCGDNKDAIRTKFYALPGTLREKLLHKLWYIEGGRFNPDFGGIGWGERRISEYPQALVRSGMPNAVVCCTQDLIAHLRSKENELIEDLTRQKSVPSSPIATQVSAGDLLNLPYLHRVVMVAAECSGIVSVGGLGPAIKGMAKALDLGGKHVRIILPKYENGPLSAIEGKLKEKPKYQFQHVWKEARVYKTQVDGMNVYFISDPKLFFIDRKASGNVGSIYDGEYFTVQKRWAHFQSGAAELIYKMSKKPDHPVNLVHVHDSQCALVPEILINRHTQEWLEGKTPATVFTYHNNLVQQKYEGYEEKQIIKEIGLGEDRAINSFIQGLLAADMTTTVSPQFALETQTEMFGKDVESFVKKNALQGKLVGIVNGALTDWDPAGGPTSNKQMQQLKQWASYCQRGQPIIDLSYGIHTPDLVDKIIESKRELCAYLRDRNLAYLNPEKPIFYYVARYDDEQKGIDKLELIWRLCQKTGCQLICVGAEPNSKKAEKIVNHLAWVINDNCGKIGGMVYVDEKNNGEYVLQGKIGGLLRTACDYYVGPSKYEPFGYIPKEAHMAGKKFIGSRSGGFVNSVKTEGEDQNGYLFERHPNWESEEQDALIAKTMEEAMTDALTEIYLMFHGTPDDKDQIALQMRMRMQNAFNSIWEKSPDGSPAPVTQIEMAYGRAFANREWRGRQQANLKKPDFTM